MISWQNFKPSEHSQLLKENFIVCLAKIPVFCSATISQKALDKKYSDVYVFVYYLWFVLNESYYRSIRHVYYRSLIPQYITLLCIILYCIVLFIEIMAGFSHSWSTVKWIPLTFMENCYKSVTHWSNKRHFAYRVVSSKEFFFSLEEGVGSFRERIEVIFWNM